MAHSSAHPGSLIILTNIRPVDRAKAQLGHHMKVWIPDLMTAQLHVVPVKECPISIFYPFNTSCSQLLARILHQHNKPKIMSRVNVTATKLSDIAVDVVNNTVKSLQYPQELMR